MNTFSLPLLQRSCGECTKCCEGWLEATIHGRSMHAGKPCFFLGKSCTIYEHRPEDPCKKYTCSWLSDHSFPEWMKPSMSNVIITYRVSEEDPGVSYYQVAEAGGKIDSSVLNWLIHWALRHQVNICYEVAGKHHVMGTAAFREAVNKSLNHNKM